MAADQLPGGRWTQEDPIGVAGGLNLYGYVGNNPLAYTDPFGLKKGLSVLARLGRWPKGWTGRRRPRLEPEARTSLCPVSRPCRRHHLDRSIQQG
ncbi:MAG: RHS repeat-associated core domain-containing protein [Gemmatimonadales bacterium]